MDCRTARLLLPFARQQPAELDRAEASALEQHLVGCPDCEAVAAAERQADDRLARAMRAVPTPPGLRAQILQRLAEERRVRNKRRLVRTAAAVGALAATVVLTVVGWWTWSNRNLEALDPNIVQHEIILRNSTSPEWIEEWFQEKYHVRVTLPRQTPRGGELDYSRLAFYDLGELQGKRVPALLLVNGSERAWLFVVPDRQLDGRNLTLPFQTVPSQGWTVELWRDPTAPRVTYVAVYNSKNLEPFLSSRTPPPA